MSDGVSWGQGSAAAQAQNDVKGDRTPFVPSSPGPESARIWFSFFFFGQNPPFESFQGASRRLQSHTPWQLLLGLAAAAARLSEPCRC